MRSQHSKTLSFSKEIDHVDLLGRIYKLHSLINLLFARIFFRAYFVHSIFLQIFQYDQAWPHRAVHVYSLPMIQDIQFHSSLIVRIVHYH